MADVRELRHGPKDRHPQLGNHTPDRPLVRPATKGVGVRRSAALAPRQKTGADRPKVCMHDRVMIEVTENSKNEGSWVAQGHGIGKKKTHFRLRLSCTIHSTLSHLQFPQGAPSTTSHRTFRARHETQALAARLLVTFGGAEGSAAVLPRFFGAVVPWEAGFGGLIVVAAGEIVSGLAVAGARTGGVGMGAGLLCVDIFDVGNLGIGRSGNEGNFLVPSVFFF